MQESRIDDNWNIDGSRDLSDSWTGFTQFTFLDEKPPDGYTWSGEQTDKTASDIQARSFMARTLDGRRSKKGHMKNPKLDNARRLRGIYFIDPEDKEFKETIRNARRKLETPMAPAMPCKTCKKSKKGETRGKTSVFKSKICVYSWNPVNLQDRVWKNLYRIVMRTTLLETETIHYNIIIWYTNLFLCLKP